MAGQLDVFLSNGTKRHRERKVEGGLDWRRKWASGSFRPMLAMFFHGA
ncbi:unnamed protein product [Bemisia tabaci]|uniref:Uncharacterized protein n=1 Tax=Bemisia tabaci TaxID=7038 RepID=A0A9P0A7R7_BEMTA|nr:unnamed protein product [Bemisia tabaci]